LRFLRLLELHRGKGLKNKKLLRGDGFTAQFSPY